MAEEFRPSPDTMAMEKTFGAKAAGEAEFPKTPSEAFTYILNHCGSTGKWQIKLFFITSFVGIFCGFHNLAAAFLAATPEHTCRVPGLDGLNATFDTRNISLPLEKNEKGKYEFSKCSYYPRNYSALLHDGVLSSADVSSLPVAEAMKCSSWNYDNSIYKSTIVTEWDLVCDKRWLMSTCQATYMGGVLAGAVIFSELSDKFGRRTTVLASSLSGVVFATATAFSPDYITFILLRFFIAASTSGMFLSIFVILMESVSLSYRTSMGMMFQAFFSIGFCVIPGIAYFIREWRDLQLAISVPFAVFLLYYWILPESPRWLMTKGRHEEALKILKDIADTNGGSLPGQEELSKLTALIHCEESTERKSVGEKLLNFLKSQKTLYQTANLRRRCLIIYFAWFVVSMIYYGLSFNAPNMNASVYLTVFLGGIVEAPSYALVSFTLQKFGRRLNLCTLFIICGAVLLLILAVPVELVSLNLTLSTMGKFFNSAGFAVAYIYSAELVPTAVRNIAVGTSSVWARIGSALAPYIVDLLGDVHHAIPSTVFGALSLLAGLLALLLPETGKMRLPETVEEIEQMRR